MSDAHESDFRIMIRSSDLASFIFSYDRNISQDDAVIDVSPVNSEGDCPTSAEIIKHALQGFLLPSGSSWRSAEGWRSLFGFPVILDDKEAFLLGITLFKRKSVRGVTPIMRVLVFFNIDNAISAVKQVIKGLSYSGNPWPLKERDCLIKAQSKSPGDHVEHEFRILTAALTDLANGKLIAFRTLAIVDSDLQLPEGFDRIRGELAVEEIPFSNKTKHWLIATSSMLRNEFTHRAKSWMARFSGGGW